LNRKPVILLLLLIPWVLSLTFLVRLLSVWDRLPASLVVHFDATGLPNGWMSPGGFLIFAGLSLLAEMSVCSWFVYRLRNERYLAPALLVLLYLFAAGELSLFWQLLAYNLDGTAVRWSGVAVAAALAAVIPAVAVVAFRGDGSGGSPRQRAPGHRGQTAPGSRHGDGGKVLAVEAHRSRRRFWINLPFCLGLVIGWMASPNLFWKGVVLALTAGVGAVMWLIWWGFRYRFTTAGIEVRGPWGRLAFLPADEIESWEVATVRPLRDLGGWGIRGGGRHRAYIWGGNRVLRITRRDGELLLGHERPEHLARHLDEMRAGTG
jgi:hypothetical protein